MLWLDERLRYSFASHVLQLLAEVSQVLHSELHFPHILVLLKEIQIILLLQKDFRKKVSFADVYLQKIVVYK